MIQLKLILREWEGTASKDVKNNFDTLADEYFLQIISVP